MEQELIKPRKTELMRRKEAEIGCPIEKAIMETYAQVGSVGKTSEALGINIATLNLWMVRLCLKVERRVRVATYEANPAAADLLAPAKANR